MSILADRASNIGIFFDFSKHASKNSTIHDRWQPSPNTVSHPSRVLKTIPTITEGTLQASRQLAPQMWVLKTIPKTILATVNNQEKEIHLSWVLKTIPTITEGRTTGEQAAPHRRVLKTTPEIEEVAPNSQQMDSTPHGY